MVLRAIEGQRIEHALDRPAARAAASVAVLAETITSHIQLVLSEGLGPLTPEQRRFLAVAEGHGNRLLSLADDLGFVARAAAGDAEVEWVRVDLDVVAQHAVQELVGAAIARGKPIELRSEPGAWTMGDPARLERAVYALLEQALDAAAPMTCVDVAVTAAGVAVSCLGESVPDSDALGVALADAVAQQHGGSITVMETEDGVTFSLLLSPDTAESAVA